MDELHGELARLDHVPRLAGDHLGLGHQVVLLQLQLDQTSAHAGGVNGGVDGPQHIGDGSDVVLVAVGDEDAPDLALVLDQIAHIRDDHVDAVHIVIREPHSAVHDHDVVPVLVDGQVFPDFIQTAQRYDFQFFCHISFLSQSIFSIMNHFVPENTRQDAVRPHDNQAKRPLPAALPRCGSVAALRPPVSSCTVPRTSVPVCLSTGLGSVRLFKRGGARPARHPAYKSNCTADPIRRFWIPNR